jgi:hypothetical protein
MSFITASYLNGTSRLLPLLATFPWRIGLLYPTVYQRLLCIFRLFEVHQLNKSDDFYSDINWLGKYSPVSRIHESGLWLTQGLDAEPLIADELGLVNATPTVCDAMIKKINYEYDIILHHQKGNQQN